MISKMVAACIAPLGTALLLFFSAFALHRLRRQPFARWAYRLATAGVVWLWLWSTPLVSDALRGTIEDRAGPREVAALSAVPVTVVLGGGVAGPRSPKRVDPDLNAAGDRLWHAARLYHAGKTAQLLLSGGTTRSGDGTEAAAMRTVLHDFGVPDSAILEEGASRTTRDNARNAAEMLRARGVDTVVLVTSALHMPRARQQFSTKGLTVIPAPTDFEVIDMPFDLLRIIPTADALEGSGRAFKELLGWLVAAR
jgi:uncharacterized SAM-binding protein YcdF (DUF218 family)